MLTAKQKEIILKYIPELKQDKAALTIYPFRYEKIDRWDEQTFSQDNLIGLSAQILEPIKTIRFGKRTISRFQVMTQHQIIKCVMYNRPYFKNNYGDRAVTITGKFNERQELVINTLNLRSLEEMTGILPVYPLKKGVNQHQMRTILKKVLKEQFDQIHQMIPSHLNQKYDLLSTKMALKQIHQPDNNDLLFQAIRTLKYSEALRYQMALFLDRQYQLSKTKPKRIIDRALIEETVNNLDFKLTMDQTNSIHQLLDDLESPTLMRRLLLGDVGSGKTIVAILASMAMMNAGYQVAFLCPTEVLAQQHYQSFKEYFDDVALLTGSINQRNELLENLKNGTTKMIVGTHALFSESVTYHKLGLLIIDEQHRFGVNQRQSMLEKGEAVDVLMLSATPIPRTLAATLYSHLSISTIETMPLGRKPIITKLILENSIRSFIDEVFRYIDTQGQVYVICPAIDQESEQPTRSVQEIHMNLEKAYPQLRIGSIHSQKSSDEINRTLDQFKHRGLDILVSTTIVEVGVHIASANMMIIYDGDRFGLSQLHQLRGRIGRSDQQAICYVLTQTKNQDSLDRLKVFTQETNGFKLAEMDLMMRGAGDLLGQRQSGYPQFTHLDLTSDLKLLQSAKEDVLLLFENPSKEDTIFISWIQRQHQAIMNQVSI